MEHIRKLKFPHLDRHVPIFPRIRRAMSNALPSWLTTKKGAGPMLRIFGVSHIIHPRPLASRLSLVGSSCPSRQYLEWPMADYGQQNP